jgi:hypothetical protein
MEALLFQNLTQRHKGTKRLSCFLRVFVPSCEKCRRALRLDWDSPTP